MNTFAVARFRAVLLILAAIVSSLLVLKLLRSPRMALLLLVGIATACPFYAVYLYWKNDLMIGGLPRAEYGYSAGLLVLSLGNLVMFIGFLSESKQSIYVGCVLLATGIAILFAATSVLFQYIVRRGISSQH